MDLRQELLQHQDLDYQAFHKSLIPNVAEERIIGVRIPILRKIAKQALRENAENRCKYYEEVMVKGFTIGLKKCSLDEHMGDIRAFVPLIDNWAVCDSFCSSLKFTKQYREEMFDFLLSYIGNSEYETRFAVVMLMDYYLEDSYIDRVLAILKSIQSDDYYVNMAVAWALSVAFVKYPGKTEEVLKQNVLNRDVQNKTIQKIKDSYRVDKATKQSLNRYKK